MAAPKISVIIPTFGRAEMTTRAVSSALAQDVDLEVLVVDDASPQPVVMERERVRVIRLPENVGAAGARNTGAAAAKSEWIAFLDSDDLWLPQSLGPRLEQAHLKLADRMIWCAPFTYAWPDGRRVTRVPRASSKLSELASGCWTCPGSTALMTKEAWRRSAGQDQTLRRLEDYEWLLRWGRVGGEVAICVGVAAQITRGNRATEATIADASAHILNKHADLPGPLQRRMKSYLALELAAAQLGAGNVSRGAAALVKSWLLHPRLQSSLEPFWRI